MNLSDLIGPHVLDAVDYYDIKGRYEIASAISFRLDGVVYDAIEDPQDGYRSCMNDLAVSSRAMLNVFEPVPVVGVYRERGRYGRECDLLDLVAVDNGKVVLTVGTDNMDDYYPSFVGDWSPQNLPQNEVKP